MNFAITFTKYFRYKYWFFIILKKYLIANENPKITISM